MFNHVRQYYGMAAAWAAASCVSHAFNKPQVRGVLAGVVENGRLQGERLWGRPSGVLPTAGFRRAASADAADVPSPTFLRCPRSLRYVENRGDTGTGTTPTVAGPLVRRPLLRLQGQRRRRRFKQPTAPGTLDLLAAQRPDRLRQRTTRRLPPLNRVCPTYAHDMAADGSDIQCLSFHETNGGTRCEQHADLWTRWDYVATGAPPMPWLTTIDGATRPARQLRSRPIRPDMEVDCAFQIEQDLSVAAAPRQAYGS